MGPSPAFPEPRSLEGAGSREPRSGPERHGCESRKQRELRGVGRPASPGVRMAGRSEGVSGEWLLEGQ